MENNLIQLATVDAELQQTSTMEGDSKKTMVPLVAGVTRMNTLAYTIH